MVAAAKERLASSVTALIVSAVMLIPFVVIGDVAGNEITHVTAAVMLGGLITATLLNQLLVPAMCLNLGPTSPITAEEREEDQLDPTPTPAPTPSTS